MNSKSKAREFNLLSYSAWKVNEFNGWWQERRAIMRSNINGALHHVVIACLGLAITELAEAIEAVRKHPRETWGDAKTKDTLVRELAGCIIRCMDLAEELGLPLGEAIVEEVEANKARGHKHGGKAA